MNFDDPPLNSFHVSVRTAFHFPLLFHLVNVFVFLFLLFLCGGVCFFIIFFIL